MYTSRGETCRTIIIPKDNVVIKQFLPRKPKFGRPVSLLRKSLDLCLYREVECLDRLKGCKNFPRLIDYNEKDLWVKMSYVGEHHEKVKLNDKKIYMDQVDSIVDTLVKKNIKVAYEWKSGDGRLGYCLSMMMFKENILSLIDFERAWPMGCSRESEFGKFFFDSFKNHNNKKFKEVLKNTISMLYEKK